MVAPSMGGWGVSQSFTARSTVIGVPLPGAEVTTAARGTESSTTKPVGTLRAAPVTAGVVLSIFGTERCLNLPRTGSPCSVAVRPSQETMN